MSRKKYCDRELDQLDRLKHENKKLKKQLAAARKELSRTQQWRDNAKELLESQYNEDLEEAFAAKVDEQRKKWKCRECHQGYLKSHIMTRRDGVFYYRKCTNCSHRTKVKPYSNEVEVVE